MDEKALDPDLWLRLERLHACCELRVHSIHGGPAPQDGWRGWFVEVHPRSGGSRGLAVEAETLIDALLKAVLAAEVAGWRDEDRVTRERVSG